MSTSESGPPVNAQRRQKVLVGTLPGDFLRINVSPKQQQEAADYEAALALFYQTPSNSVSPNLAGRLNITVAQAKLVKNYGMTRMDPYVRLRVGHCVFETHTDPSGGKNPHWNKVVQCLLPKGVNIIYVEILDECSFTMDERIAWSHITIPQDVLAGNTVEEWYPLSGKQGDAKEGMINLVLSYTSGVNPYLYGNSPPVMMVPSTAQNMFGVPQYAPVSVYTQPPAPPSVPSSQILYQIEEMFPNIDKSIIKMVFEANGGNKDASVNSLLEMSE